MPPREPPRTDRQSITDHRLTNLPVERLSDPRDKRQEITLRDLPPVRSPDPWPKLALPAPPPRAERTLIGIARPRAGSAPMPDEEPTTIQSATETPRSGTPLQPPRSLSPPPESVPTTAAEREAARLRAELRDAQEALSRAQTRELESIAPPPNVPRKSRVAEAAKTYAAPGAGVAAVITALAAILQPKPAPESVDALVARTAVLERQAAEARSRELDWREYSRRKTAAEDCRWRLVGSALEREGYLSGLPTDAAAFVSERLERDGAVKAAPTWRVKDHCPDIPTEPRN